VSGLRSDAAALDAATRADAAAARTLAMTRRQVELGALGTLQLLNASSASSQAAVLRVKLPHLEKWNGRRRDIARRYSNGIHNPRVGTPPLCGAEYVAHLYVVTCDVPAQLRSHLAQAGVQTDVHYPIPDHLQPAMAGTGRPPLLPVTERLAQRVLTLPCFPELTDDEVDRVIQLVNVW